MTWPLSTDVLCGLVAGLRTQLPWIFVAVGVFIQCAGLGLLAHRARARVAAVQVEPDILRLQGPDPAAAIPDELPSMALPIASARVPESPDLLPGASRAYRGGAHEGVDFRCRPGTPVHGAASGRVLSIDDEPNLPEGLRNEVLTACRERGETPNEVLHVLYGRRTVVYHGRVNGRLLTTSYSHLDRLRPGLKPGESVREGDLLGWTGASGTSHAYRRDAWAELHFEVRLDGQPLGHGLRAREMASLYRTILGDVDSR